MASDNDQSLNLLQGIICHKTWFSKLIAYLKFFLDLEDEFGTRKTLESLNGKEDGRFFQENGGREGKFGTAILKDNKKVDKDIVSSDKKFNAEERYGDGKDTFDRGFKTASEYLGGGVWGDDGLHH